MIEYENCIIVMRLNILFNYVLIDVFFDVLNKDSFVQ